MDMTVDYPSTFEGLLRLTARLRSSDGCPWDREQTRGSMKRYILEECYELLDAIDEGDAAKLADELGDAMFNLAFQIQLGREEGAFDEGRVFRTVIDKLVRRHPHVFGDSEASDAREVEINWHAIKRAEQESPATSILESVPQELPALAHAQVLQERAARTGFDWEDIQGVLRKVGEELQELNLADGDLAREAELGDILFSIVNLARWLRLSAEDALRKADSRFRKRFTLMERLSTDRGLSFDSLAREEKESLWQEAKELTP